MKTPNVRRRTVRAGMGLFVVVLVLFDALVFSALRAGLEANLAEVLEQRLEVGVRHATEHSPQEAAEALVALGVPATVTAPDGTVFPAEPEFPRTAPGPPIPQGVVPPITSVSTSLDDGTVVEVFASGAGVESTLRRLLVVITLGTVAALAIAYWVLRRLVDQTMRPLSSVASTAERITRGDISERLRPAQPETELGRMARSFDGMLDSLEEAIARSEREQERSHRFLADAAHQLRTPVAGIRSSVELLLRGVDPETRDRLLTHTVRETARISRLVSDLLLVARLDQGRPARLEITDLVRLCADEVERARDNAPHLDVALEVHGEVEPIEADPAGLSEALANLVDNARRHASTRVTVALEARRDSVAITVEDDGAGVPEGGEELVFDRFATLDGLGGSGLGLPIARAVARAHGGDLTYEDDAFALWIPRDPDGTPGA